MTIDLKPKTEWEDPEVLEVSPRGALPPEAPVEIPMEALSEEALLGIIKEFILREGTDYGSAEVSLETKIAQLLAQLRQKKIKISFDASTETVSLVPVKR